MKDVSAGIIIFEGRILIAKRKHQFQDGLWEFAGGKLNPGESITECLQREIKEELGIDVIIGNFFMDNIYSYENGTIRLIAYYAFASSFDVPFMIAHSQTKWVSPAELDDYQFAPADIPIKDALKKQKLPVAA